MNQEILHRVHLGKEDVIKQVMAQVLGREPQLSDCKDFELITHVSYPDREFIGYLQKGTLGELVFSTSYEDGKHLFTWTFVPGNEVK